MMGVGKYLKNANTTACVNSWLIGGSAGFHWEVVTIGSLQAALVPDVLFQCRCYKKQGPLWPEMLAHLSCQIKQFHL